MEPLFASGFMPHGVCYLWDPRIVWLHVISDTLIALAYYSIPFVLIQFARKRTDLSFRGIFWMSGAFIVGCGTTHLMEVWTIWHATYLVSGLVKALTAGTSVVTAVMLIPLLPKVLAMPSPARLQLANLELQKEAAERKKAEQKVQKLNDGLEERVVERTTQLEGIHEALRESQAQLKAIIASAMDAIIAVDERQRVVLFNQAAEGMFGCTAKDALGSSIDRFIPAKHRAQHAQHVRQFGKTGVTNRTMGKLGALSGLRANSEEFPIEASISQTEIHGKKLFTVILRDITERKRADASLARLAAIVESTKSAILSKDLHGVITSWNTGAEQLYGYRKDEALGKHINLVVPSELQEEERQFLQQVAEGKVVRRGETVRRRKDGSLIPISLIVSPVRDSDGRVIGVSTIAQDISEQKRAIEALRESQERFQAMANGIPQLAWMAEADGHIFWYNQRWYDYTGTTFEEMQGWGWQSVHDSEALPEVLEGWKGAIAAGRPFDMEFPLRGADGAFRMFLTRVMPVKDSHGRVVRWFGTNTDISERKLAEERLAVQAQELSRSREALESQTIMLQSVLDSIDEGLVAVDEHGKFTIWNPAAERIIGRGAANVPPTKWSEHYRVYMPDMVTPFPPQQNPLARALRGETSTAEMFIRNPELEQGAWIEAAAAPLRSKNGVVSGGVVAFRDITRNKTAEREIWKLNEELEQRVMQRTEQLEAANQELEAFTYSVSHDLRAPLRHISGFSKLLVEEFAPKLDPDAQHYLQRIEEGTRKMGQLVDELLNLARVGRHAISLEVTGLDSLLEEVITMLKPEYQGREVEWQIGTLPFVECDPTLTRQVFQNLLSNALKFTRPRARARIEISHLEHTGSPTIMVRDNGVGFSMKYADKLFGVFQRLHHSEDFEGTGVGLATVQRIIQKHGGCIWAEADLEKGAAFYFTLGPGAVERPDIVNNSAAVGT